MKKVVTGLVMAVVALMARADEPKYDYLPLQWGASDESAVVRVDLRETFGGTLVTGREAVGTTDGSTVTTWDTTDTADGWTTKTDNGISKNLYVLNNEQITVEDGRLTASAVWTSNTTHVIRHDVVVPSGVTLTIVTNAVVKFCPGTCIKVEDGGRLDLVGAKDGVVVLSRIEDDAHGEVIAGSGVSDSASRGIVLQSSAATFTDNSYFYTEGFTFANLPTVSVESATVSRLDGKANVQFTLAGATRNQAFSVDYEVTDITAVHGEDYSGATRGTVTWTKSGDGRKTVTVPLNQDITRGEERTFRVRITAAYGANIGTREAVIKIVELVVLPLEWGESDESAAVRVDLRDTLGGQIVTGTETVGAVDGTSVRAWDTTQEANGWATVTDAAAGTNARLFVVNNAGVSVEGGRLAVSTNWTDAATHVIRHDVVVPSGVTLTIVTNAVVKFCPGTRIRVEDGGALKIVGADGADVIFTRVNDGRYGAVIADTGLEDEWSPGYAPIDLQSTSAGYSDNGYFQMKNFGCVKFPSVTIKDSTAFRSDGTAYVRFEVGGTRDAPFSVDWVAKDGSAKFGEDYTLAAGRVSWNKSSEGVKTVQIPLVTDRVRGAVTDFSVNITTARCCNVSVWTNTVTIREATFIDIKSAEAESAPVRFDTRATFGGTLVTKVAPVGTADGSAVRDWNTYAETNGWHTLTDGGAATNLYVLNDRAVTIHDGRLASSAMWPSNTTHLIRHTVVVPNGVTLTIGAGAVVKFAPETEIFVEDGGTLNVLGSEGASAVFTGVNDDAAGREIVGHGVEPALRIGAVRLQSSAAKFTDTGYLRVNNINAVGTFPTVSIHGAATDRANGAVWVALTLSGASRDKRFDVDWVAKDGTAKFGEDYTLAAGRVAWNKTNEGTKWIQIPLVATPKKGERRTFTVELTGGNCVNLAEKTAEVEIQELDAVTLDLDSVRIYTNCVDSAAFSVDALAQKRPLFAGDTAELRYSAAWAGGTNAVALSGGRRSVITMENEALGTETLFEGAAGETGSVELDVAALNPGGYLLTHTVVDADGQAVPGGTATKRFTVMGTEGVVMHGGTITSNETWKADAVHIVFEQVEVPALYTLFLEPGAVVKFFTGTGINVQPGGGALFADGIIFTHINDDTVGGDTMYDGFAEPPVPDGYTLTGNMEISQNSEKRYMKQPPLSGTITASRTLSRGAIYEVTGNLTLASGATLTIPAGTVLKFHAGVTLTVNKGATLKAKGSSAFPVVFTSIKDDDHGGDTNGDGGRTRPGMGDWGCVLISGGVAECKNSKFIYAGGVNGNQYGARANLFMWNSGSGVFSNCIFGDSTMDGCFAQNATFENCIFYGNDRGLVSHTGAVIANNCVFALNRIGIFKHGGSFTVKNSVSAWNTGFGVDSDAGNLNVDHCCFWNPLGVDFGAGGVASVENVVGDPCFAEVDKLDFHIKAGSACVDAADGSVAPEFDYYGTKRWTIDTVVGSGTVAANGALPDIGICEWLPTDVSSGIDLKAVSVSTKATKVKPGETIFVSWVTENVGLETVRETTDEISLISSSGAAIVMGRSTYNNGIAPGGSVNCGARFRVPPCAEGDYTLRLTVNADHKPNEGVSYGNNSVKSETSVQIAIPESSYAEISNGIVDKDGSTLIRIARADISAKWLMVSSTGAIAVVAGDGTSPTSAETVRGAVMIENGVYLVAVDDFAGDVYLVIENREDVWVEYQIEQIDDEYDVTKIIPSILAGRESSVTVLGFGLSNLTEAKIVCTGGKQVECRVSVKTDNIAVLTFDSAECPAGTGSLVLDFDGDEITAGGVVIPNETQKEEATARLIMPEGMRPGRTATVEIEVTNMSGVPCRTPILTLSGKDAVFINPDNGVEEIKGMIRLFAFSEEGYRTMLMPGETVRLNVQFSAMTSADSYDLLLKTFNPGKDSMDWNSLVSFNNEEASNTLKNHYGSADNFIEQVYRNLERCMAYGVKPKCAEMFYDWALASRGGDEGWLMVGDVSFAKSERKTATAEMLGKPSSIYKVDGNNKFWTYTFDTNMVCVVDHDRLGVFQEGDKSISGKDVLTKYNYREYQKPVFEETEEAPQVKQYRMPRLVPHTKVNGNRIVLWIDENGQMQCGQIGTDKVRPVALTIPTTMSISDYKIIDSSESEMTIVVNGYNSGDKCLYELKYSTAGGGTEITSWSGIERKETYFTTANLYRGKDGYYQLGIGHAGDLGRALYHPTCVQTQMTYQSMMPMRAVKLYASDSGHNIMPGFAYPVTLSVDTPKINMNATVKFPGKNILNPSCCIWTLEDSVETSARVGFKMLDWKVFSIGADVIVELKADVSAIAGCADGCGGIHPTDVIYAKINSEGRVGAGIPISLKDEVCKKIVTGFAQALEKFLAVDGVESESGAVAAWLIKNCGYLTIGASGDVGIYLNKEDIYKGSMNEPVESSWEFGPFGRLTGNASIGMGKSVVNITTDMLSIVVDVKGCISSKDWLSLGGTVSVNLGPYIEGTARLKGKLASTSIDVEGWEFRVKGDLSNLPKSQSVKIAAFSEALPENVIDDVSKVEVTGVKGIRQNNTIVGMGADILLGERLCYTADGDIYSHIAIFVRDNDVWGVDTPVADMSIKQVNPRGALWGENDVILAYVGGAIIGSENAEKNCRIYAVKGNRGNWSAPEVVETDLTGMQNYYLHSDGEQITYVFHYNNRICVKQGGSDNLTPNTTIAATTNQIDYVNVTTNTSGVVEISWMEVDEEGHARFRMANQINGTWKTDDYSVEVVEEENVTPVMKSAVMSASQPVIQQNAVKAVSPIALLSSNEICHDDGCDPDCTCECQGTYECGCPITCPCAGHCSETDECCDCVNRYGTKIPHSCDPNEMGGPLGSGDEETERFVAPGKWMDYTIYFENQTNATAAACTVEVSLPLDPQLDWDTFELGEVVFNNQTDTGLVGRREGESVVTINGTNQLVRTTVTVDPNKGEVVWFQRIIDPNTLDGWPADVRDGFLPPNDPETHCGEGHLCYRIKVRDDAKKAEKIRASAVIKFDANKNIETDPAWWNFIGHAPVYITYARNAEDDLVLDFPADGWYPFDTGAFAKPSRIGYLFEGWETADGTRYWSMDDVGYDVTNLDFTATWRFEVTNEFTTVAYGQGVEITGIVGACPADLIIPAVVLGEGGARQRVIGVGESAFRNQRDVVSLEIRDGVERIEALAFYGCAKLARVLIPASVTYIGQNAFFGCRALTEVEFESATPPRFMNATFMGATGRIIVPEGAADVYAALVGTVFPSGWTVEERVETYPEPVWSLGSDGRLRYAAGAKRIIWNFAVKEGKHRELTILSRIDTGNGIADLPLPESVTDDRGNVYKIVDIATAGGWKGSALYGAEMTSLVIPSTVTNLPAFAFADCYNLSRVEFAAGSKLTAMSEGLFYSCCALEEVVFAADSRIETIGTSDDATGVFEECWELKGIDLPLSVADIRSHAFENCPALAWVGFNAAGDSALTNIAARAFYNCDTLGAVDFASMKNLVTIGEEAFAGELEAYAAPLGEIVFHNPVQVGAGAISSRRLNQMDAYPPEQPVLAEGAFDRYSASGYLTVCKGMENVYTNAATGWFGEGKMLEPWNGMTGWQLRTVWSERTPTARALRFAAVYSVSKDEGGDGAETITLVNSSATEEVPLDGVRIVATNLEGAVTMDTTLTGLPPLAPGAELKLARADWWPDGFLANGRCCLCLYDSEGALVQDVAVESRLYRATNNGFAEMVVRTPSYYRLRELPYFYWQPRMLPFDVADEVELSSSQIDSGLAVNVTAPDYGEGWSFSYWSCSITNFNGKTNNPLSFAMPATNFTLKAFYTWTPVITNLTARQHVPWDGLVDVAFEVTSATNNIPKYTSAQNLYAAVTAYNEHDSTEKIEVNDIAWVNDPGSFDLAGGHYSFIWNFGEDVDTNLVAAVCLKVGAVERQTWQSVAAAVDASGWSFMMDNPSYPWYVTQDVFSRNEASLRSGAIGHSQSTSVQTMIEGPGTLSFVWCVSSESGCDYLRVYVDGTQRYVISGEVNWQSIVLDIASGSHTVKWSYTKDGSVVRGSDCGWIDDIRWNGENPLELVDDTNFADVRIVVNPFASALDPVVEWTDESNVVRTVTVERTWLTEKETRTAYLNALTGLDMETDAADAIAEKLTLAGANGSPIWQSFVAGLEPDNADSILRAFIALTNGVPYITWDPDLGDRRVYTIEGKQELRDPQWISPTNSTHRFFRVTVEMP